MALKRANVKRTILAVKIADSLGIKDVSPILKNISVPASRLSICMNLENSVETSMSPDTLRHIGTAFYHHGMIKYTDRTGETYITKDCPAVRKELSSAGFAVMSADLNLDRSRTESIISKARESEEERKMRDAEWEKGYQPDFTYERMAEGYGLAPEILEEIDALEHGEDLPETAYVPFGGRDFGLGHSVSRDDATRLASFKYYPVGRTIETLRSSELLEVVENALLANADAISANFGDYARAIYARGKESDFTL